MKNILPFNFIKPFATSNPKNKTKRFKFLSLLALVLMLGGNVMGQTNIALEGFETVASTPSFGFTISGGAYTTGSTAASNSAPLSSPLYSTGTRGYGANNTTTTITSGNISTIGFSSVALSLKLGSFSLTSTGNGADATDFVKVEVSPNGGTNYYILLWQVGNSNLVWAFGNTSTYTNTYSTTALTASGRNTTAENLTITGLPNTTNLKVRITMFNDSSAELWAIDDIKITGTTSCTSPTVQTSNMATSTIATTSSNYAFTRGDGTAGVLVVARPTSSAAVAPTSGSTYTANTSFGSGSTTGTNNYVVYNGTASGVSTATGNLSITSLTAGTQYTITAYEYNTTSTCYNTTSPASTSFYTLCTPPATSTPSTVGSKSFTATWGSVTGASSYQLDVSTDSDFSSFVSGYNSLSVAGTSQAVIGLNYNITYYFRVRAVNAASTASSNSNTSSIQTKTAATSLVLVGAPSTGNVGVNITSFTVEARRIDATVDDAYTSSISITKVSGSGTISGNGAVAATSGSVTFASIQFNTADTYTISATDGTLTSATSGNIVITPVTLASDYFRSNTASGPWATAASWQSSSDNNSWITATLAPTSAANTITIRSGHNISIGSSITVDQLVIEAGATLTNGSGLTIANGTGTDLTVAGTLTNSSSLSISSGANVSVSGTLTQTVGTAITTTGTLAFTSTATYNHQPNGGTIPTASWDAASLCNITGMTVTTPSGLGQTFGRVTWNCTGQSTYAILGAINPKGLFTVSSTGLYVIELESAGSGSTYNFDGGLSIIGGTFVVNYDGSGVTAIATLNITGNLSITGSGVIDMAQGGGNAATGGYSAVVNLTGNLSINNTLTSYPLQASASNNYGKLNFTGTDQNYYRTSNTGSQFVDYVVSSSSNLTLQNSMLLYSSSTTSYDQLTVNGTLTAGTNTLSASSGTTARFTITTSGTLVTSNTGGIGSTIIVGGTKTYTAGANYTFNGVTSTPFPTGTFGNPANITLGANVSLNKTIISTGTLTLGNNVLTLNGFDLTYSALTAGTGTIYGDYAATVTISGSTGVPGTLTLASGARTLGALIMNRTGQTLTLGTDILFDATYLGATNGGRLTLTAGVVDASGSTLTFITGNTPLARTTGTLTTSNTTSLIFGTSGNIGGSSFTIPTSLFTSSPIVNNFTVNRTNSLTLSQGLEVQGALTLTSGALAIGAGNLLNLNGASFARTSGSLTGSSTSDLTVMGTNGGTVTIPNAISLRTVTVNGTRTLALNGTDNLSLYDALTVANGGTFDNGGTSQITIGAGSPTITINGKFITRDLDGFVGSNTTIPSITPTLGASSEIEYAASSGTQTVNAAPSYVNLTITNGGTKSPSSAISVSGTLTINTAAIFDGTSSTIGSSSTNLTINGTGKLIVGGTGTKPVITGTYTFSPNSTIEFSNSAATTQTIRASIPYTNVSITGSNVTLPTTASIPNLTINTGGYLYLSGNMAINDLNLTNGKFDIGGYTLTLNGIITRTAGNFVGSASSSLILNGNTNSIGFDQTTLGTTNLLKNLTLTGSGTTTLGNALNITAGVSSGTVTVGTGASLATGGFLTLKSDAYGTARVAEVLGAITGNVTVERYIPLKRAWRAITAPVRTTTSINANWQEGSPLTGNGYGFDIWNSTGGPGILTGGSGSSLLSYSSSANSWTGITNTTDTNSMMESDKNKAFMAFVTGPYGSNYIAAGANATTIRATGTLLTGDQSYPTTANTYTFIGNPYASPLDLTAVLDPASNATASFGGNVWVWDANVLGTNNVGTYNLFDFAVRNYSNISNNGTISNAQIQSGQAFFVKSTDGAAFAIKEAHKGSVWNNAVFRTAAPELLRVNLFKQINNEWAGRDGAMEVILADANANQIANKMINGNENIAFIKNGALFASEHHLPLVANDVLNVRVWKTTAGTNYKLKMNTEQFATTNLSATLEDMFTNTRTPLALDGSAVEYPFTVTTDALSTGDRFRIVFQSAALGTTIPKANGFSIVPNPVTGDSFQVNLGSLATGTYSYTICNAMGQEVEKGSINNAAQNTNYTVKLRETAATGIYIMKIKGSDNSVFTAKIIKK